MQVMRIRGEARDSVSKLVGIVSDPHIRVGLVKSGDRLNLRWKLENLADVPVRLSCNSRGPTSIPEFPLEPIPPRKSFFFSVDWPVTFHPGPFQKSYLLTINTAEGRKEEIRLSFSGEVNGEK